jgi:hypothetical protein
LKPALFLGAAVLLFALLIAGAFIWDCSRAVEAARELVRETDRELSSQEERIIRSLPAAGILGPEIDRAVGRYHSAKAPAEKRLCFEGVLTLASKSTPGSTPGALDPNDLVGRRAADEYTGALNRRQIALRGYEDAVAALDELMLGTRGAIGARFAASP